MKTFEQFLNDFERDIVFYESLRKFEEYDMEWASDHIRKVAYTMYKEGYYDGFEKGVKRSFDAIKEVQP